MWTNKRLFVSIVHLHHRRLSALLSTHFCMFLQTEVQVKFVIWFQNTANIPVIYLKLETGAFHKIKFFFSLRQNKPYWFFLSGCIMHWDGTQTYQGGFVSMSLL